MLRHGSAVSVSELVGVTVPTEEANALSSLCPLAHATRGCQGP